jgi:hypothetical protein
MNAVIIACSVGTICDSISKRFALSEQKLITAFTIACAASEGDFSKSGLFWKVLGSEEVLTSDGELTEVFSGDEMNSHSPDERASIVTALHSKCHYTE